MRVRLDRSGNPVAMGEGYVDRPTQVSNGPQLAVGNPHATAEILRKQARDKELAARESARILKERKDEEAARAKASRRYASELKEYADGFIVDANGGVSPLMALAAIQTLSGFHNNPRLPLSGYALSPDGVPHHDRGMNGINPRVNLGAYGDFLSDLTSYAKQASGVVSSVSQMANQVMSIVKQPSAEQIAAAQKAAYDQQLAAYQASQAAQAAQTPKAPAQASAIMSMKLGGVPVVYIGAGIVGLVAVLTLTRRK